MFPHFTVYERDEKGIVVDDMTDKEVDSLCNPELDILEAEG